MPHSTFSRRTAMQLLGSLSVANYCRGADRSPASLEPVLSGVSDPRLVSFDRLMTSFITLQETPGAALAVTKGGKLMYARGFGWADIQTQTPVRPQSLFRIASISKPITGAAIVKLAEQGKIKLDDRVFDVLPVEPLLENGAAKDSRLTEITLRQLLYHRGGWDSAKSFDPMVARSVEIARAFDAPPPATREQIIRYVAGRPLDFTPGERYAYSNFGYCLLGRVIEKVSGQSYEDYVRKEILSPLGIRGMKLGKTLPADRAAGEVTYYDDRGRMGPAVMGPNLGKSVPACDGGWCLEAMDSHGGWIASAVDLVRFATAFDRPEECKILKGESVRTLFERPAGSAGHEANGDPKNMYYACGWNVRSPGTGGGDNHFHAGGLDGTATLLVRRGDGLNWAVLFNAGNTPTGQHLGFAIDSYIHRAADKVREWPTEDLFAEYR